ncbi:MFS transporter [Cohnella laeviribosi]|uniref:MFS transporter n=1 Tax=Cohnella laeviribosi TaxID=380174 RepID=UPI000365500F|nr:MFS transporter [Cohnella laeviribosi]
MNQRDNVWNRNFVSISLSCFFVFFCFYTLIPTLPLFAKDRFHADQSQIGFILTVFALASLASRPFVGMLLDRFGKKRVVVAAAFIYAAASLAYVMVDSYPLLVAIRIVHGFMFGIATAAAGTIAVDVLPKHRLGEGLGYYGMFGSMAMVIGPFVGLTLIRHVPFPVLFSLLALCSFLGLCFTMLVRLESIATGNQQCGEMNPASTARNLLETSALPMAICGFLLSFAYGGISAFVSVYGASLGLIRLANYFFAVFALMIVLPRPWLGKWFDQRGEHVIIYSGIVVFVMGQIILSQAHSGIGYVASAAVLGLGYGALAPSFQTLAVRDVPKHRKGFATSTYLFFFDAGVAAGSMILGIVAKYFDYHAMYFCSSIVMAFSIIFYCLLHHARERRANKALLSAFVEAGQSRAKTRRG